MTQYPRCKYIVSTITTLQILKIEFVNISNQLIKRGVLDFTVSNINFHVQHTYNNEVVFRFDMFS